MLQIYNSASKQKEIFKPIHENTIGLYVCGITVYDYCHIGHARVFVAFDAIVRFLRHTGWRVNYVRNITDIDDKIIQRAQSLDLKSFTQTFIDAMHEDMQKLNILPPTHEPRATQYIEEMIALIKRLEAKELAYKAPNQDVYFKVDAFKSYGSLSHRDLDNLKSGARVELGEDKLSPLDFVLWKHAKPNEPFWDSPWGPGRPGWHIECAAMSMKLLGENFDLHGGGMDLLFPHHENERAQSMGASDKPFANVWLHVGFVQVDDEKMSKSLNNFFTIRDVLKQYDAEVIRYFLLSSHYRSPINYSIEQLNQAKNSLERFYIALRDVVIEGEINLNEDGFYQRFIQAMNDDFNTPVAFSILFEVVTQLNIAKQKQNPTQIYLALILKKLGNILGLLEREPEVYLQGIVDEKGKIENLIKQRKEAREAKDWKRADEVRAQLTQMGISIEDTINGTTWRKIS